MGRPSGDARDDRSGLQPSASRPGRTWAFAPGWYRARLSRFPAMAVLGGVVAAVGCKSPPAPVRPAETSAATAFHYPARPTAPPPAFKVFHQDDDTMRIRDRRVAGPVAAAMQVGAGHAGGGLQNTSAADGGMSHAGGRSKLRTNRLHSGDWRSPRADMNLLQPAITTGAPKFTSPRSRAPADTPTWRDCNCRDPRRCPERWDRIRFASSPNDGIHSDPPPADRCSGRSSGR